MNTPLISSIHLSLPVLLLLAKATIILLAAVAVTFTMQRASAGARHMVWLVTLATLLLVPALTAWSPVRLAVLPASPAAGERAGQSAGPTARAEGVALATPPENNGAAVVQPGPGAADAAAPRPFTPFSPLELLFALYVLVGAANLASLAWSGLAVRRIVRNASPLEHASWRTPLYEVADRMGLADAPRLLRSDDVKMPFACGIITPTIVLPADCDAYTAERRRAVLLHELAHVRRHDLLGHTLGRIVCALYWFHPLVWTAARQLRNESERACDDLALSCGTRATDYAEHLLEIVTSVRRDTTPSVALAMARRKEFEGRMLAILDPELRHSSPTRRQSAAMIGALALVALSVGAVSPVARPANAAPLPVAARERATHAPVAAYDANSRLVGPARTAFRSETTYARHERTHERLAQQVSEQVSEQVAQQVTQRTSLADSDLPKAGSDFGTVVGGAVGAFADATARSTVDVVLNALAGVGAGAAGAPGPTRAAPQAKSRDERARLLAKVLSTDTSAALRRVAAWGLNEYASQPVASEALAAAVRRDASPGVREMAAWSLAETGSHNSAASEALSAALLNDTDDAVRATAAWALGEAGDRGAIAALVSALKRPGAAVRMRALWAIGSITPKEAPQEVYASLRDEDANVRRVAAWALYQIEDPSAVGPLSDALKAEQDNRVQLAEIRALGALGERSVEALKSLVESSDARVRSTAVHALAGGHASGPWPWPWPQPRPFP